MCEVLGADEMENRGSKHPWIVFFGGMLSADGQAHVAGVLRQRGGLYGPGVLPLKYFVKNYAAFTGAHKALLASIQLLVFRGVLSSVNVMVRFLKRSSLTQMRRDVWGALSDVDVLRTLQDYLQASSALSFAARAQQYTDDDLKKLHTIGGDYIANSKATLGRQGVRTSAHNWLHWADTIRNHGAPLDASIGESGHQRHKRANVSGSGRDPAAHHARRVNTLFALRRLIAPGESWLATRYDRSKKETRRTEERAGPGCSRVLSSLDGYLRGGLENPRDVDGPPKPAGASAERGQFHGAATWDAVIRRGGSEPQEHMSQSNDPEGWKSAVAESGVVPHEDSILSAARLWYGCRRPPEERPCGEMRCPDCWEGERLLDSRVRCSRFKLNVPSRASSGLGRLKGGNVRLASIGGSYPRAWSVGGDSGEDVEIFKNPDARLQDAGGDDGVTLAKILYFFDHEGNGRPGVNDEGPVMEYVLVYEYVTCGSGRSKRTDHSTKHPTYYLQGSPSTKPSVFPVSAIRRHIHMYHLCALSSFETGGADHRRATGDSEGAGAAGVEEVGAVSQCGLRRAGESGGGGLVWKHHFHLAKSSNSTRQRDAYMLNEHWHSVFQDGVV